MPPAVVSRRRLGLLLWAAGMPGVAAVAAAMLPPLAARMGVSVEVLVAASVVQSTLLLALAVWAGVTLAPALGLRAPVFEAAVARGNVILALWPLLLPGLVGGVCAGILLFALGSHAPEALATGAGGPPMSARVLYGGITEELLLRWGVMTVLVWLAWRLPRRRRGLPRAGHVWLAIVVSAVLFGVGHLPAAAAALGQLSAGVAAFVVGGNAVLGVLFGHLYWRHGLEAAMVAHAMAHVVSELPGLVM